MVDEAQLIACRLIPYYNVHVVICHFSDVLGIYVILCILTLFYKLVFIYHRQCACVPYCDHFLNHMKSKKIIMQNIII